MGQNALDQSDRKIFRSTIFLEQNGNGKKTDFLHADTSLL